jgi:hypothetical protein
MKYWLDRVLILIVASVYFTVRSIMGGVFTIGVRLKETKNRQNGLTVLCFLYGS